jgi:ABC-type branched-subunit amino acid transport system ATPase component
MVSVLSMSGGEQQMLALGRALMLAPRILLVDEPSVGLAPVLVSRTIDKIKELKERYQLTVLMAEQNFPQALRIADRGYVIVHGKIAFEGKSADELNNNDLIRRFIWGCEGLGGDAGRYLPPPRAGEGERLTSPFRRGRPHCPNCTRTG